MAVTHEDVMELKKVFDQRYVLHDECGLRRSEYDDRLAEGTKQFAVINLKLSIIAWGIGIIASAALTVIIKELLELIMK